MQSLNHLYNVIFIFLDEDINESRHACQLKKQETQRNFKRQQSRLSQASSEILPDFIFKRNLILENIKSVLEVKNICILRGSSGVGKSIIAREFEQNCINQEVFKQVYEINAADDKIEASMHSFAAGMGIDIQDENNNPLSVDEIFNRIDERMKQNGKADNHLLVFEDAQERFFSRHYAKVKDFKILVTTKKKQHELKEFEEDALIQVDPFTKKEGVMAIKQFFDHYNLQVQNEGIYQELHDGLGGFPLLIFQVLMKFKKQAESRKDIDASAPIDDILRKGVQFGNDSEADYRANMAQEVDDPYLRKTGLVVKRIFEYIKENEKQDDNNDIEGKEKTSSHGTVTSPAERLFLLLSSMDIDYLYHEMFQTINDSKKVQQYERSLEHLHTMGLIHFEQRYTNFQVVLTHMIMIL